MFSFSSPFTGRALPHRSLIMVGFHGGSNAAPVRGRRLLLTGWVALLCGFLAQPAFAAVWTIDPFITLSTSYADNVTLAAKGQEQDDLVLGVSPGVSVRADGHELHLLANYGFEQLLYADNSSRNYSRQLFQGLADAVLVPDFVFVEASGRISQQLVDPLGSAGLGDLAVSENVGEVSTWTLSPFLRRRIGNLQLAAGINFDSVDYPGRLRDSYGREYRFEAGSNTLRKHLAEWQVGISRREIFFSGDEADQLFETLAGIFRYHLNPDWSVETSAGYVRNNFHQELISGSPEGGIWTAGILWTPNPRTIASAGVGEHFFGSTHYANIEHRSRFNSFQYSYTEDISSARQLQLGDRREQQVVDEEGAPVNGTPIIDPSTQPSDLDLLTKSATTEIFVGKRSKLTWAFRSMHVSCGADVYRESRHLQASGGTETVTGKGVNAGWHPSGRTDFLASYSKQTADFITGREDVYRDVKLEANRRFNAKLIGALDFLRNERQSSASTIVKYVNHVVTASVRIQF